MTPVLSTRPRRVRPNPILSIAGALGGAFLLALFLGADAANDYRATPAYRALVNLRTQTLEAGGERHRLTPGMQVSAEIHLGTRSVLEYLLSPVGKAFHEAARER